MPKISNLKLTQSEVSQTIDLKKVLGVDLTDYPEVKQAIGQAIIDLIVARTEDGLDVNGKKFSSYSKDYKESLAFKAFGKTNKVNLSQTGEMLSLMDILDDKGNKLKIGWNDDIENAKAYNHNVGDTLPKRQFFGITDEDLKKITDEFKPDLKKNQSDTAILKKLNKIADYIIEEV